MANPGAKPGHTARPGDERPSTAVSAKIKRRPPETKAETLPSPYKREPNKSTRPKKG